MIVAHNHPSGNTQPSESDRRITEQIKKACDLIDIKLLDHLIILPGEGYELHDFTSELPDSI